MENDKGLYYYFGSYFCYVSYWVCPSMSRATRQTITLLSVIAGVMKTLRVKRAFARVDMQNYLDETYTKACEAVHNWPCTGDELKTVAWCTEKVAEWHKFIEAQKEDYNTATLLSICDHIICDLSARIKDPNKLAVIEELAEPVKAFMDYSDPDWRNYPAFEASGRAINKLHELIDWNW